MKNQNSSIVNRAEIKRVAVRLREKHRPFWQADRVSDSFIDECEDALFLYMTRKISNMPTQGKTIK